MGLKSLLEEELEYWKDKFENNNNRLVKKLALANIIKLRKQLRSLQN